MSAAPFKSNVLPRKSFAQVVATKANGPNVHKPKETQNSTSTSSEKPNMINSPKHSCESRSTSAPHIHVNGPQLASRETDPSQQRNEDQLSHLLQATTLEDAQDKPSPHDLGYPSKEGSDQKSSTSRTTLTLDEKESLRPDDSASMQAATEEDTYSPTGSAVAGSAGEADSETRAFRDQLNELARTGVAPGTVTHSLMPSSLTPDDARSGIEVSSAALVPNQFDAVLPALVDKARGPSPRLVHPPDEKLVEALASPKDRLFVLKVEQDMIDLIKDSKEDFLQLPQTNSFYRMLSHKLADYYLLGHALDESTSSVRIFKTPASRLPPPLIGPEVTADGTTLPLSAPTRKIMRRAVISADTEVSTPAVDADRDATTPAASSKATSETGPGSPGEDGKGTPSKSRDKTTLTREERENRYKEARARIFKDFKEEPAQSESNGTSDDKDLSRSSSVSGTLPKKNIGNNSHKKYRKAKDDDFEARSAYSQYFNPMGGYGLQVFGASTPQQQLNQPHHWTSPHQVGSMPMGRYPPVDGNGQMMMNQWNGRGFPNGSYNGYNGPQPSNGHYNGPVDVSNGFEGFTGLQNFHGSNINGQTTPKMAVSCLAGYNPGFQHSSDAPNWQLQSTYGVRPYGMASYGSTEGSAMQTNSQTIHYNPNDFSNYPPMDRNYPPSNMTYGQYGKPQFDPRSQDFIPRLPGSNMSYMQRAPSGGSAGNQRFPAIPNMQDFQSQQQFQRQTDTLSSGYSPSNLNKQLGVEASWSRGPPASLPGPIQTPRSGAKAPKTATNTTQQDNSISKWANPASLPPKPPPSASFSPRANPRSGEAQGVLPPHPFGANLNNVGPTTAMMDFRQ